MTITIHVLSEYEDLLIYVLEFETLMVSRCNKRAVQKKDAGEENVRIITSFGIKYYFETLGQEWIFFLFFY